MARAMTILAQPPMAWNTRAAISTEMLGAAAHARLATMNRTRPASSGPRRPSASDKGPTTNCARANEPR
jgi:hypothetical protein